MRGRKPRHGASKTAVYAVWYSMVHRCTRPRHPAYARYGGRGIGVCERWLIFENFIADMGPRPRGATLDRFPDNDGDYEPGNCRWATPAQQQRNKANSRKLTFAGETLSIWDWAQRLGMKAPTIYARVFDRGWSIERALTTPTLKGEAAMAAARQARWNSPRD